MPLIHAADEFSNVAINVERFGRQVSNLSIRLSLKFTMLTLPVLSLAVAASLSYVTCKSPDHGAGDYSASTQDAPDPEHPGSSKVANNTRPPVNSMDDMSSQPASTKRRFGANAFIGSAVRSSQQAMFKSLIDDINVIGSPVQTRVLDSQNFGFPVEGPSYVQIKSGDSRTKTFFDSPTSGFVSSNDGIGKETYDGKSPNSLFDRGGFAIMFNMDSKRLNGSHPMLSWTDQIIGMDYGANADCFLVFIGSSTNASQPKLLVLNETITSDARANSTQTNDTHASFKSSGLKMRTVDMSPYMDQKISMEFVVADKNDQAIDIACALDDFHWSSPGDTGYHMSSPLPQNSGPSSVLRRSNEGGYQNSHNDDSSQYNSQSGAFDGQGQQYQGGRSQEDSQDPGFIPPFAKQFIPDGVKSIFRRSDQVDQYQSQDQNSPMGGPSEPSTHSAGSTDTPRQDQHQGGSSGQPYSGGLGAVPSLGQNLLPLESLFGSQGDNYSDYQNQPSSQPQGFERGYSNAGGHQNAHGDGDILSNLLGSTNSILRRSDGDYVQNSNSTGISSFQSASHANSLEVGQNSQGSSEGQSQSSQSASDNRGQNSRGQTSGNYQYGQNSGTSGGSQSGGSGGNQNNGQQQSGSYGYQYGQNSDLNSVSGSRQDDGSQSGSSSSGGSQSGGSGAEQKNGQQQSGSYGYQYGQNSGTNGGRQSDGSQPGGPAGNMNNGQQQSGSYSYQYGQNSGTNGDRQSDGSQPGSPAGNMNNGQQQSGSYGYQYGQNSGTNGDRQSDGSQTNRASNAQHDKSYPPNSYSFQFGQPSGSNGSIASSGDGSRSGQAGGGLQGNPDGMNPDNSTQRQTNDHGLPDESRDSGGASGNGSRQRSSSNDGYSHGQADNSRGSQGGFSGHPNSQMGQNSGGGSPSGPSASFQYGSPQGQRSSDSSTTSQGGHSQDQRFNNGASQEDQTQRKQASGDSGRFDRSGNAKTGGSGYTSHSNNQDGDPRGASQQGGSRQHPQQADQHRSSEGSGVIPPIAQPFIPEGVKNIFKRSDGSYSDGPGNYQSGQSGYNQRNGNQDDYRGGQGGQNDQQQNPGFIPPFASQFIPEGVKHIFRRSEDYDSNGAPSSNGYRNRDQSSDNSDGQNYNSGNLQNSNGYGGQGGNSHSDSHGSGFIPPIADQFIPEGVKHIFKRSEGSYTDGPGNYQSGEAGNPQQNGNQDGYRGGQGGQHDQQQNPGFIPPFASQFIPEGVKHIFRRSEDYNSNGAPPSSGYGNPDHPSDNRDRQNYNNGGRQNSNGYGGQGGNSQSESHGSGFIPPIADQFIPEGVKGIFQRSDDGGYSRGQTTDGYSSSHPPNGGQRAASQSSSTSPDTQGSSHSQSPGSTSESQSHQEASPGMPDQTLRHDSPTSASSPRGSGSPNNTQLNSSDTQSNSSSTNHTMSSEAGSGNPLGKIVGSPSLGRPTDAAPSASNTSSNGNMSSSDSPSPQDSRQANFSTVGHSPSPGQPGSAGSTGPQATSSDQHPNSGGEAGQQASDGYAHHASKGTDEARPNDKDGYAPHEDSEDKLQRRSESSFASFIPSGVASLFQRSTESTEDK